MFKGKTIIDLGGFTQADKPVETGYYDIALGLRKKLETLQAEMDSCLKVMKDAEYALSETIGYVYRIPPLDTPYGTTKVIHDLEDALHDIRSYLRKV